MRTRETAPPDTSLCEVAIKAHWEDVYRTQQETEVSWFQASPTVSFRLITQLDLPPSARILDVGGGASRLIDLLLDAGYHQPGVLDIAESALDQARERLGPRADLVEWIVADVTEYQAAHRWDLWHDRAVFHFLTTEHDRAAYRRTLARSVAPNGWAVVETFGPEGPEQCSGLPVVRYEPDTLALALGPEYRLDHSELNEHVTPSGTRQQFLNARFVRVPVRDPA